MEDQIDKLYLYERQEGSAAYVSPNMSNYPSEIRESGNALLSADELGMLQKFFGQLDDTKQDDQHPPPLPGDTKLDRSDAAKTDDSQTPYNDIIIQRLCHLDPHLGALLNGSLKSKRAYTRRGREGRLSASPHPYSLSSSPVDMEHMGMLSTSSGGSSNRIGKSGKPLLSEETKRLNHIESEKNRRHNIKIGFETLTHLVPSLAHDQTSGAGSGSCSASTQRSEALILEKSISYMYYCMQVRRRLHQRILKTKQLLNRHKHLNKAVRAKSLVLPALFNFYPTQKKGFGYYGSTDSQIRSSNILASEVPLIDIINRPSLPTPEFLDDFFAKGLSPEQMDLLNFVCHHYLNN